MQQVALCIDEESMRHPEILGLAGENLEAQSWLKVYVSGEKARSALRHEPTIGEVWIVSSDDVEPVNLAAAIKRDNSSRVVYLLASQGSGSLFSRVRCAGIDAALSHQAFVARYASAKKRNAELTGTFTSPLPKGAPDETARISRVQEIFPQQKEPRKNTTPCFFLPVVSGSGGAGKSTISVLIALLACARGQRTLLVDADFQFGDIREMLGVQKAVHVDELVHDPSLIDQLGSGHETPALLAAPERTEHAEALTSSLPQLFDMLLSRYDFVVANTGANWAEQHALLLERSSRALFIVDQRTSSLRACRHAVELCARCGIATTPFLFVVNRCSKKALFSSIDVSCALQGAPAVELRDGGFEVEQLLGAGLPSELMTEHNALTESVDSLLDEVLIDKEKGHRGSFEHARSFGFLGRRRKARIPRTQK